MGNMEGRSFLRAFEGRGKKLFRGIFMRVSIYMQKYPVNGSLSLSLSLSLSIGAPLGNLEGIRLPGLFERKGCYIPFPLFCHANHGYIPLHRPWFSCKALFPPASLSTPLLQAQSNSSRCVALHSGCTISFITQLTAELCVPCLC